MRILVERQLGMDVLLAALRVGEEGFLPVAGPFHRPADQLRRPRHQRMLGKVEALHAEAAADIVGDDAHLVRLGTPSVPAMALRTE